MWAYSRIHTVALDQPVWAIQELKTGLVKEVDAAGLVPVPIMMITGQY